MGLSAQGAVELQLLANSKSISDLCPRNQGFLEFRVFCLELEQL